MIGVKKNLSRYGTIEIANIHPFSKLVNGFKISPYMQEKMVLIGQNDCYDIGSEQLSSLLLVSINPMQLFRVTNRYGKLLEEDKVLNVNAIEEESLGIDKQECVYAMVDGSMLFTREEKWKEVKVGRIFKESDCLEVGGERGWIKNSLYETYLGNASIFTDRMDRLLSPYNAIAHRLIFICDGAKWIWKWVAQAYPQAVQILDWYHAIEHLNEFAKSYFKDEKLRKKWVEEQKEQLHQSQTDKVLKAISELACTTKDNKEAQRQLLQYYQTNKCRMNYKAYTEMGTGTFSSGPIESAHREVIQKRMKLSGQMWTKKGAQNMLTLRSTHLSGKWDNVLQLICQTKIAA